MQQGARYITVETKVGKKNEVVYDIDSFPYKILDAESVRGKRKISYLTIPAAFDIETTSVYCPKMTTCAQWLSGKCGRDACVNWIEPYSFIYHWQVCIGDKVCFGRTVNEFLTFIQRLRDANDLSNWLRLPVYVHNLGFEFQHIRSFLPFTEIFARQKRKPIRAYAENTGIEFRCSYMLSNMTLEKAIENTPGAIYTKGKDFDYDTIRTPSTELTEEEESYCYKDVRGLTEYITFLYQEDNPVSIPMTNTGFVRRECRTATLSNPKNKKRIWRERLSADQYAMCKEAFRGGNTHANHLYVGDIIKDVGSYDYASSYPYVMMTKKYPGAFIPSNEKEFYEHRESDAFLFRAEFENIEYIGASNIPYIPIAKSRNISLDRVRDNGRILSAGYLEITLTEVDFKIIESQYRFDSVKLSNVYRSRKDYLPVELRGKIAEYFRFKCELKDVPGKEYEYMKSKNRLNGIYGMSVTDIINEIIDYCDEEWSVSIPDNPEEILESHYKNRNTFLSYQWGVWVTAYARENLEKAINIAGDCCIYVDTDSVKYEGDLTAEFEAFNKEIMAEIDACPIKPRAEVDEKVYCMGIMEPDKGVPYREFITWGAKKYCYLPSNKDSYHTTVAGLGVEAGAAYINKHGISAFQLGTVFHPSGKLGVYYSDKPARYIEVNGEKILAGSGTALMPVTYTLGISNDFAELLNISVDACKEL